MLVVEQDPVEPEVAQHLHHGRRGEGAHDAEGRLPGVEPLLERVLTHDRWSISEGVPVDSMVGAPEVPMRKPRQRITPFLWFDHQAEEAANFYVSIFKNSRLESIVR